MIKKPERADALQGLKYYNKGIHRASFSLPQWFADFLEHTGKKDGV
jgi:spermidine synthase